MEDMEDGINFKSSDPYQVNYQNTKALSKVKMSKYQSENKAVPSDHNLSPSKRPRRVSYNIDEKSKINSYVNSNV